MIEAGMKVTHVEMPGRTGTVVEYTPGSSLAKIAWHGEPAMPWHDVTFLREVEPPQAQVCRCSIKDLCSVGHTDPKCPERHR